MKKRLILYALIAVVLILSGLVKGTFSWFSDVLSYQKNYEIADIKYEYSGTLISTSETETVIPGQPLISSEVLYLTNKSKIDTNLRIKIHFSYIDQITHETVSTVYSDSPDNIVNQFMIIVMDSNWIYDASDSCWHYQYEESFTIPASTTDTGYSFGIMDGISFDGSKVDNSLSGTIFKVQLIFQAKQLQFVDWLTLGTQDIENLVVP